MTRAVFVVLAALGAAVMALLPGASLAFGSPFIRQFNTVQTLASTVPANGDVNPYGTAVVPRSAGNLHSGDVLVSNFNNAGNEQGTGTTIVEVSPSGAVRLFAHVDAAHLPGACPGGIGLTTALSVLRSGWVVVGSLPTSDGTAGTAKAGCLLVLDSYGRVAETISGDGINGPWDMTAFDTGGFAALFVTNVLNGTVAASPSTVNGGTVVRLDLAIPSYGNPIVLSRRVIASGFPERTDPAALVIGPTGVGLAADGSLYVADTLDNRVAAIRNPLFRRDSGGTGSTVSANGSLNGPLGLAVAPNGDILTVNSLDGNIVETTPGGQQVALKTLDSAGSPPGAGALFGLAVKPGGRGVYFVDDATNTLNLLS